MSSSEDPLCLRAAGGSEGHYGLWDDGPADIPQSESQSAAYTDVSLKGGTPAAAESPPILYTGGDSPTSLSAPLYFDCEAKGLPQLEDQAQPSTSQYHGSLCLETIVGSQGHHGDWVNAPVDMRRSESQITASTESNCTMSTSVTAETQFTVYTDANHSAVTSPTMYPFPSLPWLHEPLMSIEGSCAQSMVYGDPGSLCDPLWSDVEHVLSAAGSQHEPVDDQLPQTLHFPGSLQPFDTSRDGIEAAAQRATYTAAHMIANRLSFRGGVPQFVSHESVQEALQSYQGRVDETSVRAAVQSVLYQRLFPLLHNVAEPSYDDVIMVLIEAAYHLQMRLQGPEASNICYYAIVSVLAELTGNTMTDAQEVGSGSADILACNSPSARSPTSTGTEKKEKNKCPVPGCESTFGRAADMERHRTTVHSTDGKGLYACDYKMCQRHDEPFQRPDHFRDHLRFYHKEDLPRRGNNDENDEWWSLRAPFALYKGWWRCSRCFTRVLFRKHGYTCSSCGKTCEKQRQERRKRMQQSLTRPQS